MDNGVSLAHKLTSWKDTMKQVTHDFRPLGQDVLDIEQRAIAGLKQYIDEQFNRAVKSCSIAKAG